MEMDMKRIERATLAMELGAKRIRQLEAQVTEARDAVNDFVNPSRSIDCMHICSKVQGILKEKG